MKKVLIAAGGTGGHILPALVLAEEICDQCQVFFCAVDIAKKKHFFEKRPFSFYSIDGATPFHKNPLKIFKSLISLFLGILQAFRIFKKEKPDLVVGFGSFHSFPSLAVARMLRLPYILFEPNLCASKVNRLFSKRALFSSGVFREIRDQLKGPFKRVDFPIWHQSKASEEEARAYFGLDPKRKTLLIFGGSQGAKAINQLTYQMIPEFFDLDIQVIHIAGKKEETERLQSKYRKEGISASVRTFEKNMFFAFRAANLAICRAGAATLSELIYFEVPAILIPFPRASENHQKVNAEYFCNQIKGGILQIERKTDSEILFSSLLKLIEKREEKIRAIISFKKNQKSEKLSQLILDQLEVKNPYYLIGIGGIGMSALALILLQKGYPVYGSDKKASPITKLLEEKGAQIVYDQKADNIQAGRTVVYSSAIPKDHPELKAAKNKIHRSDLLDHWMRKKLPLLVAGTHGKTTTTALLSHVMEVADLGPSYAIGGTLLSNKSHGYFGEGEYFVGEADESDGSFLKTPAYGAILTNVRNDHLEFWQSQKRLHSAFEQFIAKVVNKKLLFWCKDDEFLTSLKLEGWSFGFSEEADYRIERLIQNQDATLFDLTFRGDIFTEIQIPMLGRHNVSNAAAIFSMAHQFGLDERVIRKGLASFPGLGRRCERKGVLGENIEIYDDYAHHPTEILTTLQALKSANPKRNLIAVVQPHRYSRVKNLSEDFANSFQFADQVILTDIYSAGEKPIKGVSSKELLKKIRSKNIDYLSIDDIAPYLKTKMKPHDIIVTLGAGDITNLSAKLLE